MDLAEIAGAATAPLGKSTICKACGAQLQWCVTANKGRDQPLNRDPDPSGNVVLGLPLVRGVPTGRVVALSQPVRGERYMPHHATCPESARFRRNRNGSKSKTPRRPEDR